MILVVPAEGGNEHWWEPKLRPYAVQQIELNEDFIAEEVHAHTPVNFQR